MEAKIDALNNLLNAVNEFTLGRTEAKIDALELAVVGSWAHAYRHSAGSTLVAPLRRMSDRGSDATACDRARSLGRGDNDATMAE